MKKRYLFITTLIAAICIFSTCKKKSDDPQPLASAEVSTSCNDINLFSLQKDIALGAQVDSQIRASPKQYNILDSSSNVAAYQYLYKIRDNIFAKGNIDHQNDFKWRIAIIKDDTTLNAFCTPGGYIFVYTGIIKYLVNEDDFAGVLGHEMGHAALRHSTDALIKEYGLSIILNALGNKGTLANIAAKLTLLKYSRCHETQADEYSVAALRYTKYKCDGAASFFKKLLEKGNGSSTPVFLSTHPGDASRVQNIEIRADSLHCNKITPNPDAKWSDFQKMF